MAEGSGDRLARGAKSATYGMPSTKREWADLFAPSTPESIPDSTGDSSCPLTTITSDTKTNS